MATVKHLWAKVAVTLPRHPKTQRLALLLGVSMNETIGILSRLWIYCLEFRPQGAIPTAEEIKSACGWDGDAETLTSALCDKAATGHGFMDDDGGAMFYIHDWRDYTGGAGENFYSARREEKRREEQRREEAIPRVDTAHNHLKAGTSRRLESKPALRRSAKGGEPLKIGEIEGLKDFFARLGLKPPSLDQQEEQN